MMDNVVEQIKSFAIERLEVAFKKLHLDTEYNRLQDQASESRHDLIGDNPEIRKKYSIYENIEGQIECEHLFQAYLQGIKDAQQFKALLG